MILYGDYIPNKEEWDIYTKINLSKLQKFFLYLFNYRYYYKWNMYNELKKQKIRREELD